MKRVNRDTADEIVKIIRRKRRARRFGAWYYECVICLDLETTSILEKDGTKWGYCYIYMLSVDGNVYGGRKLEQLGKLLRYIAIKLRLDKNNRIIIFVNNLGFDFQFFRHYIFVMKLLAREGRDVLYAICDNGFEFRCSYALTGYSLAYWGKQLGFNKLEGYKYNLCRNSLTPLSLEEQAYCERDVLVMHKGLTEKAEREGGITKFELTKTGYVRKFLREMTIYNDEYKNEYRELMKQLTLTPDEYKMLHKAFAGGFTHANAGRAHETQYNLESYDLISAYPGCICAERFPMEKVDVTFKTKEEFHQLLDKYACLMTLKVKGVNKIFQADSYISYHKLDNIIKDKKTQVLDNGRVVDITEGEITITDVDYRIIRRAYKIDEIEIVDCIWYRYAYLPKAFILAVLKLYNDKTLLKNDPEKIIEYILSKENLNATYGCCVTDVVPDEHPYVDGEWKDKQKGDVEEYIDKYNNSSTRMLSYAWGVWITAHCRNRLWQLIFSRSQEHVYCDTDSDKLLYSPSNAEVIDKLNSYQKQKLMNMCEYYNIDFNLCQPHGYVIGTFMQESVITRFKTLGSKRYLTEGYKVYMDNGQMVVDDKLFIKLTFSGINDKKALSYMFYRALLQLIKTGKSPYQGRHGKRFILNRKLINGIIFDNFKLGIIFPSHAVGKTEHAYNDSLMKKKVIDYLGNEQMVESPSSVYLANVDYEVKANDEYEMYSEEIRAIFGVNQEWG